MRPVRVAAIGLGLACTPSAPAKHPDHAKVSAAHERWCAMLAELDGEALASWRHGPACRDAFPSASSALLEPLTACFRANAKTDAPDSGAVIATCSLEILGRAEPGDVRGTELYQARCGRQERCQAVSAEVCAGAWDRLDGATQALLSSKYNRRAQAEIATCLADSDCTPDEDAAEAACYEAAHEKLVWLPLSLGLDPSVGPKLE